MRADGGKRAHCAAGSGRRAQRAVGSVRSGRWAACAAGGVRSGRQAACATCAVGGEQVRSLQLRVTVRCSVDEGQSATAATDRALQLLRTDVLLQLWRTVRCICDGPSAAAPTDRALQQRRTERSLQLRRTERCSCYGHESEVVRVLLLVPQSLVCAGILSVPRRFVGEQHSRGADKGRPSKKRRRSKEGRSNDPHFS